MRWSEQFFEDPGTLIRGHHFCWGALRDLSSDLPTSSRSGWALRARFLQRPMPFLQTTRFNLLLLSSWQFRLAWGSIRCLPAFRSRRRTLLQSLHLGRRYICSYWLLTEVSFT